MRWRGNLADDVRTKRKFLWRPFWNVKTEEYVWLEFVNMEQRYRVERVRGRKCEYWEDLRIVQ